MILQFLSAILIRELAGERFGVGWCPSDDQANPDPKRDCYFPTKGSETQSISTMFCDKLIDNVDLTLGLSYTYEQTNKYCPTGDEDEPNCKYCMDWKLGVGCARMRDVNPPKGKQGFKYNKFLKGVPTIFQTKWNSGVYETDDGARHKRSRDWEPIKMWVGCEKNGDDIKPVEMFIEAPNPTGDIDEKMLPQDFFKKLGGQDGSSSPTGTTTLEKLTIRAKLSGLRWMDIPSALQLKELDLSGNSFNQTGWPQFADGYGVEYWYPLQKLNLSGNSLGNYPNRLRDEFWAPWETMQGLTKLDLSHNKIDTITPCTFGCTLGLYSFDIFNPNLKSLDLSYNELGDTAFSTIWRVGGPSGKNYKASDVLKGLTKLKFVDLSHNKLTHLPPNLFTLSSLKNLESVDLRYNQLTCLPNLPKGHWWSEDGPFYHVGNDLDICEELPRKEDDAERATGMTRALDGGSNIWFVVPVVAVVGAGFAVAFKKADGYKTMI